MAQIKKLQIDNETLYPVTIPQAVVDPDSNKTTREELDEKVDKVTGKQLSTEDYTTAEKLKVANIPLNTTSELALKFDKSNLESARSQSTIKAPTSKLFDDELNKKINIKPGKNLLNPSLLIPESRILANGSFGSTTNTYSATQEYTEILPDTDYSFSRGSGGYVDGLSTSSVYIAFYDANKSFISSIPANTATVKSPANAKYIRYTITAASILTVQIEASQVKTSYVAYNPVGGYASEKLPDNIVSSEKIIDYAVTTNKIATSAINESKTTFFNPSKNLFDVNAADIALDNYVRYATGALAASSSYNATGFIPVTPGQTYTRSYEHQMAFYNASKVYVSGLNDGSSPTFTVPENAYFVRCTVAKSAWANFQLEIGTVATQWESYGFKLKETYLPQETEIKFENDIITTKKQYFLSNSENSIYFEALVKRIRSDEYVRIEGGGLLNRKNYARITNPTTETLNVPVKIYDINFNVLKQKAFDIAIGNKTTDNGAVKGIYIGDSLSYNGGYILAVNGLIPNISWDGIRKSYAGDVYGEGRGGWRLSTYFTAIHSTNNDSFTPFMHPVDPYRYYGNTAFWMAVVNGDTSYERNGFAAKAAEIGFNSATGLLSTPFENDCMWNDANSRYERWNGSAWVEISEATLNFTFNFAKYRSTWMIDQPNIVTVMLGTNDFRNQASEAAINSIWESWNSQMNTLCSSVLSDSPSAKIAILLSPASCGSLDNVDGVFTAKQTAMMWYGRKLIVDNFDNKESESIYVVDTGRSIDPEYGFANDQETPFSGYTGSEKRLLNNNNPHPSTDGYKQLGVPLAAWIQKIR